MASTEDKAALDPSSESEAYKAMSPKWAMLTTLLGGTACMRAAGMEYLPQHDQESATAYNERLERNTLYNMVELTLDSLVGRPFYVPAVLPDDAPDKLKEWAKDVDARGTDLSSFLRDWFRECYAKNFASVQIEMPVIGGDREVRTLEDDIKDGHRPYLCLIKPECAIYAMTEMIENKEVLTHFRMYETVKETQGFIQVDVNQIRVLKPGEWEIYREERDKKSKKVVWKLYDSGVTDFDFIPIETFYVNREGLLFGKPPLEDMAYLNVRHWQSTSDQIAVTTVARFPMLAVAGAHDAKGDVLAIGPRQLLGTRDPSGRYYYVEHTGAAIGEGIKDLEYLEERMAAYGAAFLRKRISRVTGSERKLDSSETMSPLRDAVVRFEKVVNSVLKTVCEMMDVEWDDRFGITINKDYTEDDTGGAATQALSQARQMGDIDQATYLRSLQEQDVISDTINVQEVVAATKKEREEKEARALAAAQAAAALKPEPKPEPEPEPAKT